MCARYHLRFPDFRICVGIVGFLYKYNILYAYLAALSEGSKAGYLASFTRPAAAGAASSTPITKSTAAKAELRNRMFVANPKGVSDDQHQVCGMEAIVRKITVA